ncbi:MAG: HEAT repeat domain-containing protein, partial [Blastocatellia bacterium]
MISPHPRVREHALRLAEGFAKSKAIQDAVLAMTADADARVRFQTALTLGQIKDQRALNVLADLAIRHGEDQWFRLAVLSSVNDSASHFFALLRKKNPQFDNEALFTQLSALIGGKHDANELAELLRMIPS